MSKSKPPKVVVKTEKLFKYYLKQSIRVFLSSGVHINLMIYQGDRKGYDFKKFLKNSKLLRKKTLRDTLESCFRKGIDKRLVFSDTRDRRNQCSLCYDSKKIYNDLF